MGQQCVRQRPVLMDNNPRDEINQLLTIKNGCQPLGSAYLKGFIPKNDEYEWIGDGELCYYCSFDPGSEISCSAGCNGVDCCSIVGRRGVYTRKRYLAKELDCCISGLHEINGQSCNPSLQNKENCELLLRKLCTQNETDIFDKDVCKRWCDDNTKHCKSLKVSLCNRLDPSNVKECLNFCMSNMGKCDKFMEGYCKMYHTDKRCSCYNSTQLYNPICVDKNCIDNGYQSTSMLSSRGDACKIIDCRAKLDIQSEGKVDMKDIVINTDCGSNHNVSSRSSYHFPWVKLCCYIVIVVVFILLIVYFLSSIG